MRAEILDAMALDSPHEMNFCNVASGYIVSYRCECCGKIESFDCGWIERLPTYAEAKENYPLFLAHLDNVR